MPQKKPYFLFNFEIFDKSSWSGYGLIIRPHISQCFFYLLPEIFFRNCSSYFQPQYYPGYVDDILVLFTSPEDLETFKRFLNCCHAIMSLTTDNDKKTEFPFLIFKLSVKREN